MKRAIAVLVALASIASTASANDAVQPVVEKGETLVLVEASGVTKVRPDIARFELGVVTVGLTAREALNANNDRMARVIAALKDEGIEASNIQTSDFRVSPQYRDKRDSNELSDIIGYRVTNEVYVEFRDLERAGDIVSLSFDAGANTVSGPRFRIDDAKYEVAANSAEQAAIKESRRSAENIARSLGLKVSRVLRVSNTKIDFDNSMGERGGDYIVVTGSRIAPTPIEAGEMSFSAEVFVEYALVSD